MIVTIVLFKPQAREFIIHFSTFNHPRKAVHILSGKAKSGSFFYIFRDRVGPSKKVTKKRQNEQL